jgi:hypothetical protein
VTVIAKQPEHPDDLALPATKVNGIQIPKTYKQAVNNKKYGAK